MKSTWIVIATAFIFTACSSSTKTETSDTSATQADAKPAATSGQAPTTSEINDRYGLKELDGAANALKVIADQSKAAKNDTQGEAIIGCAVTGAEAASWLRTVQSLIDTQASREREQYSTDPKGYARDKSFETCASNCSCDAYARVLKNASIRDTKKGAREFHEKSLLKLQAKAARISPESAMACARKQSWLCGSDLHTYLKSKSSSGMDF